MHRRHMTPWIHFHHFSFCLRFLRNIYCLNLLWVKVGSYKPQNKSKFIESRLSKLNTTVASSCRFGEARTISFGLELNWIKSEPPGSLLSSLYLQNEKSLQIADCVKMNGSLTIKSCLTWILFEGVIIQTVCHTIPRHRPGISEPPFADSWTVCRHHYSICVPCKRNEKNTESVLPPVNGICSFLGT